MAISLSNGNGGLIIGSSDFFFSLFSTVYVQLEQENWGSRYPILMNELYQGKVELQHLPALRAEVTEIREIFKKLPREKYIWDCENRAKPFPWGDNVSDDVVTLADYFTTSSGSDLFEVMLDAIDLAELGDAKTLYVKNI